MCSMLGAQGPASQEEQAASAHLRGFPGPGDGGATGQDDGGLGSSNLPWGDTDGVMGKHWHGVGRHLCDGGGGAMETEPSWLWAPSRGLGRAVGDRG